MLMSCEILGKLVVMRGTQNEPCDVARARVYIIASEMQRHHEFMADNNNNIPHELVDRARGRAWADCRGVKY
jgi:hypothetical protein